MATIDTEIEISKLKILYRRKMVIFQSLRRENAGEKFKFYIIIEKNISPVFKKTNAIFFDKNTFLLTI
jgi:hypothetical protein